MAEPVKRGIRVLLSVAYTKSNKSLGWFWTVCTHPCHNALQGKMHNINIMAPLVMWLFSIFASDCAGVPNKLGTAWSLPLCSERSAHCSGRLPSLSKGDRTVFDVSPFIDPRTLGYEETVIITLATVSVLAVFAIAAFFGYRMMHGELPWRHAETKTIHYSRLFKCFFWENIEWFDKWNQSWSFVEMHPHTLYSSERFVCLYVGRRRQAGPSQPEYDGGCRLWELSGPRQSQTAGG